MIFIKLTSGLGNQMFQYAFARSLAYDLNQELYLDISRFNFNINVGHIIYGLQAYNIDGIVGNYPIESYNENNFFKGDMTLYEKGGILTDNGFYRDNLFFNNRHLIKFPAYFVGYYQFGYNRENKIVVTEEYFKHNKDIIHNDFKFVSDLPAEYNDVVQDILQHDSIALHVRRGEYKNYPQFGMCTPKYYNDAIDKIVEDLDNPKFFIFTKDLEWFKDNIDLDYPYRIIDFNEDEDLLIRRTPHHLKLMSLCKHFIIANSTYSWWGSWLSNNPNKKIIAPQPWFQDRGVIGVDTIDGITPISIPNNYEEYFNKSQNSLFKFKDFGDFEDSHNLEVNNESGNLIIKTIGQDPKLIVPLSDNPNELIIKISFKTYNQSVLIFFYTLPSDNRVYSFNLNYYENESVSHFVILPKNIQKLWIRPATQNDITIILEELEVKELNNELISNI